MLYCARGTAVVRYSTTTYGKKTKKRTSRKQKKSRKVPQQVILSLAITDGKVGEYTEGVLRSRRELSELSVYSKHISRQQETGMLAQPGHSTLERRVCSTLFQDNSVGTYLCLVNTRISLVFLALLACTPGRKRNPLGT